MRREGGEGGTRNDNERKKYNCFFLSEATYRNDTLACFVSVFQASIFQKNGHPYKNPNS